MYEVSVLRGQHFNHLLCCYCSTYLISLIGVHLRVSTNVCTRLLQQLPNYNFHSGKLQLAETFNCWLIAVSLTSRCKTAISSSQISNFIPSCNAIYLPHLTLRYDRRSFLNFAVFIAKTHTIQKTYLHMLIQLLLILILYLKRN